MRDNHWWFFDLALVIAVTGGLTFGVISGVTGIGRIAITIPLVLFLPGYALVSALFPDEPNDDYRSFDDEKTGLGNPLLVSGGLEAIERAVLSAVCSVALVSAIALLATATPRGIVLESVLLGISMLTVALALLAIASRYRCPPDQRFVPSISSASPFFTRARPSPYGQRDPRPYNAAIAVGLLLLLVSGGFAVANPPQHDGFTEFSVGTENVTGETETMYKSTYTAGERQELETTITNQEHEEQSYTTVVLLQRVRYDGENATVNESTELTRQTATVADGESHRQTLEFTPTMRGNDLRLTLLLYEGEAPAAPSSETAYRTLHLPVEVS